MEDRGGGRTRRSMIGAPLNSRAQQESLRVASHVRSCDPPLLLIENFDDPQRCFNATQRVGGSRDTCRNSVSGDLLFVALAWTPANTKCNTMGIATFTSRFSAASTKRFERKSGWGEEKQRLQGTCLEWLVRTGWHQRENGDGVSISKAILLVNWSHHIGRIAS